MTTANVEIIRVEEVREKEGRDGRIRERNMVLWIVVQNGDLLTERETLRDAKAYVEKLGLSATVIG